MDKYKDKTGWWKKKATIIQQKTEDNILKLIKYNPIIQKHSY